MKKIILLLLLGIILMGCTSTNNKLVLDSIKRQIPNDNFYFIRGLERDRSLSTNIRYRGIVYSDKLREEKAFTGIQVALENMDELWKYEEDFVRQYENALAYPRATKPIRENAKRIFRDDIIVYVDFPKKYIHNRYYGLTPIKSTKKFIEDMGLDIYSTKKGAESMIKNKIKEDDKKGK